MISDPLQPFIRETRYPVPSKALHHFMVHFLLYRNLRPGTCGTCPHSARNQLNKSSSGIPFTAALYNPLIHGDAVQAHQMLPLRSLNFSQLATMLQPDWRISSIELSPSNHQRTMRMSGNHPTTPTQGPGLHRPQTYEWHSYPKLFAYACYLVLSSHGTSRNIGLSPSQVITSKLPP
jgi:hypothetical protein